MVTDFNFFVSKTPGSEQVCLVGDALVSQQGVHHALAGQIGAVPDALVGAGRRVGGEHHVLHGKKLAGQGQRLLLKHVQPDALLGHHLQPIKVYGFDASLGGLESIMARSTLSVRE